MSTVPLPPESPCVRNCCLDDDEVCLGCGRKLREIVDWHRATPEARTEILRLAAGRIAHRGPGDG